MMKNWQIAIKDLDKATYNSSNESPKLGVTFCDRELRHTMIMLNGKKKHKKNGY